MTVLVVKEVRRLYKGRHYSRERLSCHVPYTLLVRNGAGIQVQAMDTLSNIRTITCGNLAGLAGSQFRAQLEQRAEANAKGLLLLK